MTVISRTVLGSISPEAIRRDRQSGINNLLKLFDSGKFKINGAIVSITKGDSLTAIANKINRYTSRTGIKAEVVNNNQLILKSKKTKVDIVDYGPLFNIVKKNMLGTGDNCLLRIVKAEFGDKISEDVMINYSQGKKTAGHRNVNPLLDGRINGDLAEIAEDDDEAARRVAEEAARRAAEAARIREEEAEQVRIIDRICKKVKKDFKAQGIRYDDEGYTEENYNDLVDTMKEVRLTLNTFNYNYLSIRKDTLATDIFELLNENRINNLLLHPIIYWGGKFAITDDSLQSVKNRILADFLDYMSQ